MMEVSGETFRVAYDQSSATLYCEGSLRLYGAEGYTEIVDFFNDVAEQKPELLTLDLTQLQFLNSSGINALSKFVIKVRNLKASRLVVKGSHQFPWQSKSLKNLQRLMPDLILQFDE